MPLNGLRGNRELLVRLQAEIASRPSHAYLFSGPAGIGKALAAEGFCHSLLCERSPGADFCCRIERCPIRLEEGSRCDCCAACVQIASRVHPDFTHVARPAGRTDVLIEQVRALIAQLWIRPSRAGKRAAVIDDAGTLNIPAQNALLKTLEEPPGHAIIFVVTDSERVLLDTVRSRLRLVRFGALAPADIEAILTARGVEGARVSAIARLSRGSAARALALVEGDEPPAKELIEALRGIKKLDAARAIALAQEFFSNREGAAENFELIARMLEEILCFKLLRERPAIESPEVSAMMTEINAVLDADAICSIMAGAVRAEVAVEAMANPRLQAENFFMAAAQAARGE
jgi:DNA polymerase III subunit delta'